MTRLENLLEERCLQRNILHGALTQVQRTVYAARAEYDLDKVHALLADVSAVIYDAIIGELRCANQASLEEQAREDAGRKYAEAKVEHAEALLALVPDRSESTSPVGATNGEGV